MTIEDLIIIASTRQVGHFYDVSGRLVQLWLRKGCPKLKRNQWDLKAVNQWYLEHILGFKNGGGEDLLTARTKYWTNKAEREALQVARLKENSYDKNEVHQLWAQRVSVVKNGLLQLNDRLPPMVQGEDEKGNFQNC